MRGVIPQATEQQGMPVYAYYQKVTASSLRAFNNRLYFISCDEFRR
jgi:hypothetical protein